MNCELNIRRRRRRLSVWVLIFSLVSATLFGLSQLRAEAEMADIYQREYIASGADLSPNGNFADSGTSEKSIGLVGIIISILAAIIIIAVIIFTVRGGGA